MSTSYDQIIALIIALSSGEADDMHFRTIMEGGAQKAYPVALAPCPRPLGRTEIEGKTIVCGTVTVPEDHAQPEAGTLDLVFTVLRSNSSYPAPDPVVHLHGGPGAGVLGGLRKFAEIFDPWRDTRDIVIFDQRAAGLSARSTTCYDALTINVIDIAKETITSTETEEDTVRPSKLVADCVRELQEAGVGLENFNTYQNALDVRAVVKTLGYETYNLYGISYGTKLSLEVMRSAPEGLRSVIIDGVAPPAIHLYDTLAVPEHEAILAFLAECKADKACNRAYPDLGQKLNEAYDNALAGKVRIQGATMPPQIVSVLLSKRNGQYGQGSYTAYIPAAIYEMARGEEMPTVAMLVEKELSFPLPGATDARNAAKKLTDAEERLVNIVLAEAEALKASDSALDLTIQELKDALLRDRTFGPLAALFDEEMSKAIGPLTTNPERLRAAVIDYAAMQNATPSKDLLRNFVSQYFDGAAQQRLQALVTAMSDSEVQKAFDAIRAATARLEKDILGSSHLWIYACQEDRPYNSLERYREVTDGLEYGRIIRSGWDRMAQDFYTVCELFEPQPREGFHDPVVSDIPTLSIGSTWDVQTAASWAQLATETLSNSQSFIIPEAGHGAVVYQPCVVDMGVAFINDPSRKLDNSCAESARPTFYIAPWVEEASQAQDP